MNFQLSKYQQDIIDYVRFNKGNLLIDAKAGSGKTSTLILIADELIKSGQKCLFLSFNKSIVDELKLKIPTMSNNIKTVHSLGLSFIRSYLYKKHNTNYEIVDMDIGKKKVRTLCKAYYDQFFMSNITNYYKRTMSEQDLKELHSNLITDFVTLCNFIRLYCGDFSNKETIEYITNRFCKTLPMYIEDECLENYYELVSAVINKILNMFEYPNQNMEGKYEYAIDFLDMIFLPVYYNMSVPYSLKDSLDTILIDESQDLSQLQQMFVRRLYTGFNRFIFVGDRNQSIYGFNGADTKAIDRIKSNFAPKELPLSICYRCPEKVVRLSQQIVPDIEWNKNREDKGNIAAITYSEMKKKILPGDILIGRKNKDLLKIYKDFTLVDRREVKFKNKDLVNAIQRDITQCIRDYMINYAKNSNIDRVVHTHMNKFMEANQISENSNLYKVELDTFINNYIKEHKNDFAKKEIMKSNQTLDYLVKCMTEYKDDGAYMFEENNILTDYYDIIEEFLNEYKQNHSSILVSDFITYIENFLNASLNKYNVPIISSIHSMKGGESDTIYIYNYPSFPYKWGNMLEEDKQQESNVQYVALTRAKKNLYLMLLDTSKAKSPEHEDKMNELNSNCIEMVDNLNNLVDNLNASKYNQ